MAKHTKKARPTGKERAPARKKKSATKSTATVATLELRLNALTRTLRSVLPLHLRVAGDSPVTDMRKVQLWVADGSPDVLNAWVGDELVLHTGKRSGEARPRLINEVIILTVEAWGNPGQPIQIDLANTDRTPFADSIPGDRPNYQGGNRYIVK